MNFNFHFLLTQMSLLFLILIGFVYQANGYSIGELQKTVKHNQIKSIEELLPFFPEELKRTYTLQHRSSGLQEASLEYPRVFLFGMSGKFIATFNGHPSQKKYETIEILEYVDSKNKFQLHEIEFDSSGNLQIQTNPSRCLACHGNFQGEIHPIFQEYKTWNGFFGEFDDQLDEEETAAIVKFNKNRSSHPRYKNLMYESGHESKANAPFVNKKAGYSSRPNLHLMDLLFWLNSKRITEHMKSHPMYDRLLPLLTYFSRAYGEGEYKSLDYIFLNKYNKLPKIQGTVVSKKDFSNFIFRLYAAFNEKPPQDTLNLPQAELYRLIGLGKSDFSLTAGEGTNLEFFLGLFEPYAPVASAQPYYAGYGIVSDFIEQYPGVVGDYKVDTIQAILNRVYGYSSIHQYDGYSEKHFSIINSYGLLQSVDFPVDDKKLIEIILKSF